MKTFVPKIHCLYKTLLKHPVSLFIQKLPGFPVSSTILPFKARPTEFQVTLLLQATHGLVELHLISTCGVSRVVDTTTMDGR